MIVDRRICLLAVLVVATAGASFGWVGAIGASAILVGGFYVLIARSALEAVMLVGCLTLLALCVLAVILPMLNVTITPSILQQNCMLQLRSIAIALDNYHRD